MSVSAAGAAPRREEEIRPPATLVIFGASGDLTRRLLAPAIAHLNRDGAISPEFAIVGIGRSEFTDEAFRAHLEGGAREFTPPTQGRPGDLPDRVSYVAGDFGDAGLFRRLREKLEQIESQRGGPRNRIFYFATPPDADETIVEGDRRRGARQGRERLGAGRRREAVRPRPRVRPPPESGAALGLSREADLSDRPLPRQGDRPEHLRAAIRQRHLRAALEPSLRRPRPDLGRRVGRRGPPRRRSTRAPGSSATCSRTI